MIRLFLNGLFVLFLSTCSSTKIIDKSKQFESVDSSIEQINLRTDKNFISNGKKWIISTQGKYATEAAADIFKSGGNIIDAAVAASLAISVERPHSSGLGGGGFLIYYDAKAKKNYVFDFRERAGEFAHRRMYLDKDGEVIKNSSSIGRQSVAIPGLIKGLRTIHQIHGKTKWKKLFKPAINLAQKGFPVYPSLALALEEKKEDLSKYKNSKEIFLKENGDPLKVSDTIVQTNLAKTLEKLSLDPEDFYKGKIAHKIVEVLKDQEGKNHLTLNDFKRYQVKKRIPLRSSWNGYEIVTMPPPSSGGVHIIQMLKMLSRFCSDGFKYPSGSSERWHYLASAMQLAYADRSFYLGDDDYVRVPLQKLTSDSYLKKRCELILDKKASKGKDIYPGKLTKLPEESLDTTHFSIMDHLGNVVVSTQTINGKFGSAIVAGDTGIVLNNEMDDFSVKIGAKNIFGATSTSDANEIYPGKTPLSSMSPTIIFKNGEAILALGAPGGTRIITSVTQVIINYLVDQMSLEQSISYPRIHQQWSPDELTIENMAIDPLKLNDLSNYGWKVKRKFTQSTVMAVAKEADKLIGVADPRDIGTVLGD